MISAEYFIPSVLWFVCLRLALVCGDNKASVGGNITSMAEFYNFDAVDGFPNLSANNRCALKWEVNQHLTCHHPELCGDDNSNRNTSYLGKKILVVHIGKTGGAAAYNLLADKKVAADNLHVNPLSVNILTRYDYFLITVREPVERVVSAFNFMSPYIPHNKGRRLAEEVRFPAPPLVSPAAEKEFYKYFHNITEFSHAIAENSDLGRLARRGNRHIYFDMCYYLGGMMDTLKLPQNRDRVFVVHQDHMAEDLNYISKKLQWGVEFDTTPRPRTGANFYVKAPEVTQMDMSGAAKMSGYYHLTGEYALYHDIMDTFSQKHK